MSKETLVMSQDSLDKNVSKLYSQIANRSAFSYDSGDDAMYQLYKQRYMQSGQKSMMDTIGQGSSLTGGYNNSYAQSMGQQAYNDYINQLNDKMLSQASLAQENYNNEGTRLQNLFSNANTLAENYFSRDMQEQNLALQKEILEWQKSQLDY